MILRKYMSLLGVGSARIDLILTNETFQPGEYINGIFLIKGGTIEQQIKRIDCDLMMKELTTGYEKVIDTTTVLTSKLIQAEEMNQISFTFKLPDFIQHSSEERSYYFRTRLTFNEGVKSKDQDVIIILPKNE
ncbi:MAG TPA: sporulation protein [Pseudoneobacillus sp.]|nr:sporulation protein [Pseudoneobacillus sp.]